MNRLVRALLALSLLGLIVTTLGPAAPIASLNDTITICHRTLDEQHPLEVITVSSAAWPAHQAHGDLQATADGSCFVDDDDGYD